MKIFQSYTLLLFFLTLLSYRSHSQNEVTYFWSGAIQPNSAKVNAKLSSNSSSVRLAVSTNPDLSNPIYGQYVTADASNNLMAALSINGLVPNQKYYYAIESTGILDNSAEDIGTFVTPQNGPFSFKFTVGSCLNSNTNHEVFNRMDDKQPLFFLSMGDFHYDNPNSATNISLHRQAYENNLLSKPNYNSFFKNYPLVYVWDDHDFSGNDSDSTAAGKANARQAYREYVPHYPFGTTITQLNAPIYQAFTIGRVHFILTDLRSSRRTPTMMGAIQKQWFKDQCIYARDNGLIIAWVTSVSFGGNQADNWGGFVSERTELANFFRDNTIRNMFLLSGDAHMVAIDNGSNHDFSTGATNPNDYPVFQSAALNQSGSTKGGIYSEGGTFPNPSNLFGQYGLVEVTDAGDAQIQIKMTGFRVTNTGTESELTSYTFSRTLNVGLPVKIISFKVLPSSDKQTVSITWETEESNDCERYELQKSNDGISFYTTNVNSCKGSGLQTYEYIDVYPFKGWNYYRLKIPHKDGHTEYSAIKKIELIVTTGLKLEVNAMSNMLQLSVLEVPVAGEFRFFIKNMQQQIVEKGQLQLKTGYNRLAIPISPLPGGIYTFSVLINGKNTSTKFLVK